MAMKKRSTWLVGASVTGSLVLAFIGVTGVSAAIGAPTVFNWLPTPQNANHPDYPKNSSGQTYGSGANAEVFEDRPDLTLVHTDQGGTAYVPTKELEKFDDGKTLGGPKDGDSPHTVQAYESDGKTPAGTYTFGGGTVLVNGSPMTTGK